MKFGHKIGLAFLVLTILTVVTGCIGLLFVYRVLSALGAVGDEGPLVRNLEDLNRYLKKAVTISRDISPGLEVEDLLQLRRDFNRVAGEFDRAFQEIRREVEDEISLGRLEQLSAEQRGLKDQTQSLIGAIIDELQVERRVSDRLLESEAAWREIVEALGRLGADAPRLSFTPGGAGLFDETFGGLPPEMYAGAANMRRQQALSQVQHLLMLLRLELHEYFGMQDPEALDRAELRVRMLFARATAAVGNLSAHALADGGDDRSTEIEAAFAVWRDAFTRSDGALETYKRKVELKRRTDSLSARIQGEAVDTLRVLDSLVSIRHRLLTREGSRGFVTAVPSLLILTIAAATLISALLGIILTMNITRPVHALIGAAEAVGKGDYAYRLRIDSNDELAQLGGAFNRMIAEIGRSQDKIRTLNAGLEQRVRARTRELEEEIRERKKADLSLRESQERYRTLIESFPSGIIALIDRSLTLIAVGGEGLRRAGVGPQDYAGRRLDEICPPEWSAQLLPRLEEAFSGAAQDFEWSAAGLDWHVTVVCNPSVQDDGPESITVLALDVTEAKRTAEQMRQKQQQLVQADKLASLGVLVAGMAHEINNPNQAIMMGGQLVRRAWPDVRRIMDRYVEQEGDFLVGGTSYRVLRETLDQHLLGIVSSSKRIEAIVSSLKGFARQDPTDMSQLVNLNVVVRSALILLTNVVKKATDRLDVRLAPGLPAFRGNVQQVEQVVVNLVHNACQALLDRSQPITVATYLDDGRQAVILEVRDEGAGMSPEELSRIMDPFYTTKRDSGGTGLGLSVSATIVKEHGGGLEFASRPGEGTTVRVRFPAKNHPSGRL